MLSCNGIVLNYAIVMYDKSKSEGEDRTGDCGRASRTAGCLYFLCDSWYIHAAASWMLFIKRASIPLRTEERTGCCTLRHKAEGRRVRPSYTEDRCRCQPRDRGSRSYYIYRYEGKPQRHCENAVVLISYPKDAFHVPKPCGPLSARMSL